MKPIELLLPPDRLNALAAFARARGIKRAQLIRDAIDYWLWMEIGARRGNEFEVQNLKVMEEVVQMMRERDERQRQQAGQLRVPELPDLPDRDVAT